MAEQDKDQKTEEPTGKRLSEARERGQVPVSRETAIWVALLGTLVVVGWVLPAMSLDVLNVLRGFLEGAHTYHVEDNNAQTLMFDTLVRVAMASGIAFCIMLAAVIAGVMVQTGFFFALDLLSPDFSRLSPSRGLSRLFSSQSLVDFGKSVGKLTFLGGIAFLAVAPIAYRAPEFAGMQFEAMFPFLHKEIVHLISLVVLAFTIIAAADLFYTRFSYIQNLRMSKNEVKDEFKQQEGDPMIKQRLRQLRAEKARKRMMAQVPKADVVITNPTHYAIALQYDGGQMSAPVVLAKGINLVAERIREIAEDKRIPIVSNPPLARALYDTAEIDQQIPFQHYRAVAEVISYVFKLKRRRR